LSASSHEIAGKQLGLLGFGAIGHEIARIGHLRFGMRVCACRESALRALPNLRVTAHLAGLTDESLQRMGWLVVAQDSDCRFRTATILSVVHCAVAVTPACKYTSQGSQASVSATAQSQR